METKNFEAIEFDAIDSPVKDIKWYGKEDRTEETLMHDKGKGDVVSMRLEEYQLNPELLKNPPTEEQVLTPQYIKDLQTRLWADGLRMVMKPRLSIDKGFMRIITPCQATSGNTILEDPKLLQEWIR